MTDLEHAAAFYARQGYDFGVDNLDVIRMLAEYNRESLTALKKTFLTWADMHSEAEEAEAMETLRHAALYIDEYPY